MITKLILIRGLPGSGKSTLAKRIIEQYSSPIKHIETDMFFVEKGGDYSFDAKKLSQAHHWCQAEVRVALSNGNSVVVSNTFVQRWEMQPYRDMAKELNVFLEVLVCKEEYGSIHQVPKITISNMRKKWEVSS
ncbi:ATP-binding protein [Vibrio sp. DW001]|uniref:ATP-binding protein n=1 Tax=Vibrio sp. DW001 TaxID=2912315 RepID=UPI0023B0DA60|nr:ATP-binding protein [Vibrio sp. DW001]WED29248.1 ATP-binding protein [Vibrio sp. DW001]